MSSVTSALEQAMEMEKKRVAPALSDGERRAQFKEHDEPYDLFVGVPVHRVPDVLVAAGLAEDGWVAVDPTTYATRFPGVWAIGDCTEAGIPKAGTFAESAARVVAAQIVRQVRGEGELERGGRGLCYIEYGDGEVGRVDVDFFAPGGPTAPLLGPTRAYAAEKAEFGAVRRARWFGSHA